MPGESKWTVEFYLDDRGHSQVSEFLDGLDRKTQAGFYWAIDQLQTLNIQARKPLVKHIEGKLWELRRRSQGSIYRLFYFFFIGKNL